MKKFRLPAMMIVVPIVLTPFWYYLNTDEVGSIWYGEKLSYCNILGCEITRHHFFVGAFILGITFITGIIMLLVRLSQKGAIDAKN